MLVITCRSLKAGWYNTIDEFMQIDTETIIDNLKQNDFEEFSRDSSPQQVSAWKNSIKILKKEFKNFANLAKYTLIFEYMLPREGGRRPDVILLSKNHVLIFEFEDYSIIKKDHIDQVSAYSRDIKNYHHMSHEMHVVPILITTKYTEETLEIKGVKCLNKNDIGSFVNSSVKDESYQKIGMFQSD